MSAITEHKKCICVEFGDTNNNKVWQYTLYDDDTALTEWGRVGKGLQSKITSHSQALKKWREKTNSNNKPDKMYTEVKAVDTGGSVSVGSVKNAELKDVAKKQIKSKNPVIAQLIDFLVQVNAHQILKQSGGKIMYDANSAQFKTPLGVIDPVQVAEARDLLVMISDFVKAEDFDNKEFGRILNSYLRLIPHDVGMSKISTGRIFPNTQTVIAENDLLDGLETSFIDITTKPTKKKTKKKDAPQIFNVEMEIVSDKQILSHVKHLYQSTRKSMHQSNNLSVQTVYAVTIKNMKDGYDKHGAKMSNIWQLWHGTKASNLLSIMRQGLIIPSSSSGHVTGRMYSDGVYFSDISTKALNYATNYWGGGGNTDKTFMFLADVAMGNYHIAKSSWTKYPIPGSDSTWAKGRDKGGVNSGVVNDEMIVYRLDQCNLVYLVEFVPNSQLRT
jgi:poly [ADP-ribose] polymerase 2/3/4